MVKGLQVSDLIGVPGERHHLISGRFSPYEKAFDIYENK